VQDAGELALAVELDLADRQADREGRAVLADPEHLAADADDVRDAGLEVARHVARVLLLVRRGHQDLDAAPDRLALGALTPSTTDAKLTAALATIGAAIDDQVSAQLASEDPKVRALAVSVVAKLDSKKTKADGAITTALADPSDQVRASAMQSIAVLAKRRGSASPELVGALSKTLGSASWSDRRVAALTLGKLGTAGDVPALLKAAKDSSSFVREAVAIALGEIGGPQVTETLQGLAKDDVAQVREAAQRALSTQKR